MDTPPLGSTELTNQLLQQASQTTGIAAPTFPTINSTNTNPATPINPVQPTYPNLPDTSNLATTYEPLAPTAGETNASNLTARLQDLNDTLSGKSAYQTEQNTAAGVDQIQQSINDNNTAIKQLTNDTAVAKLNQENRQAPMFAISGEQGAIDRSSAVKALTLSSISDVLNNNLVAAQAKADRAVAAQYGPIEAEIKAKTANLQLILNDPATTLADKNRAAQQQLVLNKQTADIAQAKQDKTDVLKVVQDAGQNATTFIPSTKYPTLSVALNAISQAKSPVEALQIQAETGLNAKAKLDTSITEIGGRKVLVNNQTGATIKDLGSSTVTPTIPGQFKFTPSQTNTGANKASLSVDQFNALNPEVKNFYVHATAAQLADIKSSVDSVKNGSVTIADANTAIDGLAVAQPVKDHLKSLVSQAAPAAKAAPTSTGVGDVWSSIKSLLGF